MTKFQASNRYFQGILANFGQPESRRWFDRPRHPSYHYVERPFPAVIVLRKAPRFREALRSSLMLAGIEAQASWKAQF